MNFSIIQKSQLEGAKRIDAEYYQPEYLVLLDGIKKHKFQKLGLISHILRGNTPKEYGDYEVPIVRSGDLSDTFINEELLKSKKENIFYVKKEDVLISSIGFGSIGKVNIFDSNNHEYGTVAEITVVRDVKVGSYYLWAFLKSKYGQFQINREITGATGQLHLNTGNVQNILIPLFVEEYQEFKKIYDQASKLFEDSKKLYLQAEEVLLKGLGLKSVVFDNELSYIVNFSDVQKANRVDAEYFQPKYGKLNSKLKSKQTKALNAFVKNYSTGYAFKSENYQEEGTPLIRINNIKKGFIDLSDTAYLSDSDYLLSPDDTAKPGDIVLSMSGTIGMSAVIPSDVPKCSINQRILRFTPEDIDANLLVLILNSIVGNFQLERIGTGGVQTNISYKDIQNILIPVLSREIQKEIAELVKKSHEARKKSKELLEEAKRKVEELIEKGGEN